ncbi:hypothetical protein AAG906_017055 [Vitis piasezkii]
MDKHYEVFLLKILQLASGHTECYMIQKGNHVASSYCVLVAVIGQWTNLEGAIERRATKCTKKRKEEGGQNRCYFALYSPSGQLFGGQIGYVGLQMKRLTRGTAAEEVSLLYKRMKASSVNEILGNSRNMVLPSPLTATRCGSS